MMRVLYRIGKFQIISVFAITLLTFSAYGQNSDCDGTSHVEQMACQGKRIQNLDDELNRVYKLALGVLPDKDEWDSRKGKEQLRKSQRAWLAYYREQCALEGGLEGGYNAWVTTFAADCEEKQLKNRIDFLQSIADETFEEF